MNTWEEYKSSIKSGGKLHEDMYILGIDLGTTNSVISYWDDNLKSPEPIDVSNGFGRVPMPSVVQLRKESDGTEEWVIGEEAFRSIKLYPESTVRSAKRNMGTAMKYELGGTEYSPEEISAKILLKLIDHVQSINPKAEIAGLVVSVPYDFDDAAKKATVRACELAGLKDKLICLIEEPKAAALAYNIRHQLNSGERILVFDFGGGTLDITLFCVAEKDDAHIKLQVISEGGETQHGGDNVDETLLRHCFGLIKKKTNQDAADIAIENQVELSVRSREIKERLSGVKTYRIPFTFCIPSFVEAVSREAFEAMIDDFREKTRKLVLKALREAYTGPLPPESIDRVLLEGGSSHMPWVREMLSEIFAGEDKIYVSERPAVDISLGATYYAAMKMGLLSEQEMVAEKYSIEFEVTVAHDIGFELNQGGKRGFFTMIRRGTSYALAKKSQIFTLSGDSAADMTSFSLKILERMDKDDSVEKCRLIGEVEISGLPERPSGKTRLKITLAAEEESGLIKGLVEDIGFDREYPPSGFTQEFDPDRFKKATLEA